MNFIPYGKQDINDADIESVINVLKSDFLTQGPKVPLFEKTIADYCGANYGVATNSATSALHIACLALGLKQGDILWTTPNTFVSSANCGLFCGAKVDFVDIDTQTYNLCPLELEKKLIKAKHEKKLPKILIPVHFAGQSCDMRRIHALSLKYNFKIIEDASHAIGGRYLDKPVGDCRYSDITVFSFHPVKIITTGEGGLATTNCKKLSNSMRTFCSHGVTRDPSLMTTDSEGAWFYQQVDLGFNYRLTDIQAILGVSQMKRLDDFVLRRHALKDRYDTLLSNLPLILPYQSSDSFSALHLYPVQIDLNRINKTRAEIFDELRANNLGVNVHYIPVHTQPHYQKMGFKLGDYRNAENYYSRALSIPIFNGMTNEQQDQVVNVLQRVLS